MKLYTTQQHILLDEQPLGSGAEGNVYEIVEPQDLRDFVVKVYHSHEQSKNRQPKIAQLIEANKTGQCNLPAQVILPQTCVYDSENRFVGFMMPKVDTPYHLTSLCSLNLNVGLPQQWYNKYHRDIYNLYFRLVICKNLAELVTQTHKMGHYIFADLKPENIKINWRGEVFILDTDSIQITDALAKSFYPAEKITPEYAPPEAHHFDFKHNYISENWDVFSLGVIFYKILLGLHPYTGTCLPPYEDLVSNEQKIQANLLPIGKQRIHFDIVPEPHQNFEYLPLPIQSLFKASFQAEQSLRPTAGDWQVALETQLQQMEEPTIKTFDLTSTLPLDATSLDKQTEGEIFNNQQVKRDVAHLVMANLGAFIFLLILIKFVSGSGLFQQTTVGLASEPEKVLKARLVAVDLQGRVEIKRHQVSHKVGLFDRNGHMLLPYDYEWIGNFREGLASIVLYNKTGYVNYQGKIIIPMIFDEGWEFVNGFAQVRIKQKRGLIDHQGQLLTPLIYDRVWNFDRSKNGLARVERNGKQGFIDQQGKTIIPVQYDWVDEFADSTFTMAKKNNRTYKINRVGKVLEEVGILSSLMVK